MRGESVVKRFISFAGFALMTLALVACESEPARYFRNHVNEISQDAVVRRFGPPHRVHELSTGDVVWAYETRTRSDCTAHILRFDRDNVLRDWDERPC